MKKVLLFLLIITVWTSCKKEEIKNLKTELESSSVNLSDQYIIACAAGMRDGFMGDEAHPVSMFFYPVAGATNFKCFETSSNRVDKWDYSQYQEVNVNSLPVFNGYLRRFPLKRNQNRWGIVTYEVNDSTRICDPVHIKVSYEPTVWAPHRMFVANNGLTPSFNWQPYPSRENAIHFNVVSDSANNLISGTYTADTTWSFYDLSNVTLNIRDISPAPSLIASSKYTFTLMSVSKDNWVTTFGQKEFMTP